MNKPDSVPPPPKGYGGCDHLSMRLLPPIFHRRTRDLHQVGFTTLLCRHNKLKGLTSSLFTLTSISLRCRGGFVSVALSLGFGC